MLAAPAFLFGATVATLWAGLYQLLWGTKAINVLLVWAVALVGFAVGQLVGTVTGARILCYGQVQLLLGSLGSWAGLGVARLLKV